MLEDVANYRNGLETNVFTISLVGKPVRILREDVVTLLNELGFDGGVEKVVDGVVVVGGDWEVGGIRASAGTDNEVVVYGADADVGSINFTFSDAGFKVDAVEVIEADVAEVRV